MYVFFLIKYLALFQGQLSRPVWSVSYAFVCVFELPALGFLILPFIREPFASLTLSVYHHTKVLEPPLAFLQFLPHFIPSTSRLLLPYTVLTTWGTPWTRKSGSLHTSVNGTHPDYADQNQILV